MNQSVQNTRARNRIVNMIVVFWIFPYFPSHCYSCSIWPRFWSQRFSKHHSSPPEFLLKVQITLKRSTFPLKISKIIANTVNIIHVIWKLLESIAIFFLSNRAPPPVYKVNKNQCRWFVLKQFLLKLQVTSKYFDEQNINYNTVSDFNNY